MKKYIPLFFLFIALLIISCDKVKNPQIIKNTAVGTTFVTKSNSSISNYKKVLLEDYTGHKCGNCPPAAVLAETLEAKYKDTLVVMAVHAGGFAKVHIPDYPASYTTTAGNDWDSNSGGGFAISFPAGNPNGMVNRTAYPGFALVHKDTWATTVALAMKDPFIVKLDVTTNYDPTARALNTDIKATFKLTYTVNTKISVVLTEDSIIGSQTDYTLNPDLIPNYRFDNVLRGAINGSWGDILKAAPIAISDSVKVSFPNVSVDPSFNDKKVSVLVFVYDETTKAVLQAEKVKIR